MRMLGDPVLTRGSRAARSYSLLLNLSASPGARAFPNMPVANFYQTELGNTRVSSTPGQPRGPIR